MEQIASQIRSIDVLRPLKLPRPSIHTTISAKRHTPDRGLRKSKSARSITITTISTIDKDGSDNQRDQIMPAAVDDRTRLLMPPQLLDVRITTKTQSSYCRRPADELRYYPSPPQTTIRSCVDFCRPSEAVSISEGIQSGAAFLQVIRIGSLRKAKGHAPHHPKTQTTGSIESHYNTCSPTTSPVPRPFRQTLPSNMLGTCAATPQATASFHSTTTTTTNPRAVPVRRFPRMSR